MTFPMYRTAKWIKMLGVFSAVSIMCFTTSCKSDPKSTDIDNHEVVNPDDLAGLENVVESINEAKKILYALPSPLETAMLIKNSGAAYNEELLNPDDNVDNYTTNKSMALNLGIYTTDLSFASLFDQTQTTISYMTAAKKMADGLDILDAIDDETIEKLEENVNNREVIMEIISETFLESSSFLQEDERQALAAIVMVGGWVEGLYIATQLVKMGEFENNKLVTRIADQKLSYENVIKLMEQHPDHPDVTSLLEDVNALKKVFDKITYTAADNNTVVQDDNSGVATIVGNTKMEMSEEVFNELSDVVSGIRTKFTK